MKIIFYLLGFLNLNILELKASILGWTGGIGLLIIKLVRISEYLELFGKVLFIIFITLGIVLRWREYKKSKKDEIKS